jgi:ankyrin repeat protein
MSKKQKATVEVSKNNIDPRDLVNVGIGVEKLTKKKKIIEISSDSEESDNGDDGNSSSDQDESLNSEEQKKRALDFAEQMNKKNLESFSEMQREKSTANDAFAAALRDELEKEERRKARMKLKKYFKNEKLKDEQKEKERIQKLCDEIFSLAGYGLLKELKILKENAIGFDDALKNYKPNLEGEVTLLWACENNELAVAEWLLNEGCDATATDSCGRTICLLGAWAGATRIIQWGIDMGVDPYKKSIAGDTMAHEAAFQGHGHVIMYLQELGFPFDEENDLHETPFLFAVQRNRLDLIDFFAKTANCNLRQLGYRGRNAVHYCAVSGMLEAMEHLWDNYRDVFRESFEEADFDGKKPIELSIEYKNDNITEFLIGALNITDITFLRKLQRF